MVDEELAAVLDEAVQVGVDGIQTRWRLVGGDDVDVVVERLRIPRLVFEDDVLEEVLRVADRARGFILDRKLRRRPDMKNQEQQQNDSGRPDQLRIGLEEVAVAIDCRRANENLEVTSEMTKDEQKHEEPGHRHEIFLPQRRSKKT